MGGITKKKEIPKFKKKHETQKVGGRTKIAN